jgi:succinate dehydrogenase / fumarate reductase flavoprotein subunit
MVTLRQLENTQERRFFRKSLLYTNSTCIPVSGDHQLTLMSESLRNDGRIWVPAKLEDAQAFEMGRKPTELSEEDRDYYLERRYPSLGSSS